MKDVSGNCSIPFGLFGSNLVPEHIITSIEIIDNSFIITGDEIGQIFVWKINSLVDIAIHWYFIGHSDKILNICNISNDDYIDKYFVTFSIKREIGVWNCTDGRCIKFDKSITADHLFVLSYKPASRACNLLLCCGRYPGIHILDSLTLKTTMHLKSRGYPNWIQSLCAFEHQQAGVHVVLGLSVSGAAILWTIETLDESDGIQVIYETESRILMLLSPVAISMCPTKLRFVLVISGSTAQIYDAANWTLLCIANATKSCFLSGRFLDAKTVLLQSKNGQIHIYGIPFALDAPFDTRNDFPLEMNELCLLGTFSDDTHCHTVLVKRNELTVVSGFHNGMVNVWRSHLFEGCAKFHDNMCTYLTFSLANQWSQKNFLSINDPLSHLWQATCCHYAQDINSLILGMDNGDIVIADMLHTICTALFPKHTSSLVHTVFHGHRLAVLSLLYTEITPDDKKISSKWLWSGSADFSVRLWDFEDRKCIQVFNCHSGPVKCIIKSPMLGMTRAKHDGHIRANKNKEVIEQEVLKPINPASWFGPHLYVSLDDDNGIAFLSVETRKVIVKMRFFSEIVMVSWRRDHVVSLIECADGSVTVWELCSNDMDRCASGQLAKDILDCSTDKTNIRNLAMRPAVIASVSDRLKRNCGSSLTLHSIRIGLDKYGHILIVDTEALLVDLYRSHLETNEFHRAFIEAQLLLTIVNQWTNDVCLDKTLESTLGLVPITGRVSNGHLSLRFGTISFQLFSDTMANPIFCTQKLIAGVAICHALNNLPEKLAQFSWFRLVKYLKTMQTFSLDTSIGAESHVSMRQVCCLFATALVTSTLPTLLSPDLTLPLCVTHVQLILQQFLQKYQDRCLEIREAARTLFNSAVDCLKSEQRAEIVHAWVIQSRVLEYSDDVPEKVKGLHRSSLSSILDMSVITDWRSGWALGELYDPKEICRMQAMAIAFLAAVGSRYGSLDSRSPIGSNTVSPISAKPVYLEKAIPGFGVEDYRLARITCGNLMRLLSQVQQGAAQWPEMRRLSITLLGQGFPVWEPYLEVGTLFGKLLEIVSGAEKALSCWSPGQLLSDEMDASRSARSTLLAIAISRPKVFATVLSIEVLRLQMQSSSSSNSANAPNGSVGSKSAPAAFNHTQPPLLAARHEVVEIIKVLCERKTREMHEVFPEIMDVLLACLNKLELRQFDLQQLFPPILLFRIASSHTASGKVCVGTRTGHVVFYDVKLGKYNTSPGHKNCVTSVTFSPDGKQVASYSMPDNSVCIWQLSSSGLFGMGSSHQVRLISSLNVPPVAVNKGVSEEDSNLLLWLEWYENRSIHLVTNAGLVNKIKL